MSRDVRSLYARTTHYTSTALSEFSVELYESPGAPWHDRVGVVRAVARREKSLSPPCAKHAQAVRKRAGLSPSGPTYAVVEADLHEELHGSGLGVWLYAEAARLARLLDAVIVADACAKGSTSTSARRVWGSTRLASLAVVSGQAAAWPTRAGRSPANHPPQGFVILPYETPSAASDVADAVAHAQEVFGDGCELVVDRSYTIPNSPTDSLDGYDDVGAWLEMEPGELAGLGPRAIAKKLEAFRGKSWAQRAISWRDGEGRWHLPPLVLVICDDPEFSVLGDGRGRYNLAVGLGLKSVPLTFVRVRCERLGTRANPPPSEAMRAKTYWHGTARSERADGILREGLRPPESVSRGHLAPRVGHVYLTPHLSYAIIYAVGGHTSLGAVPGAIEGLIQRHGRYGYLFEVSGSALSQVEPDEDSVGAAVSEAMNMERGSLYRHDEPLLVELQADPDFARSLLAFARKSMTPRQLDGIRVGFTSAESSGGKRALRTMPDWMKLRLLAMGAHVANHGSLPTRSAWRFDRRKLPFLRTDGANFFDLAERVDALSKTQETNLGTRENASSERLEARIRRLFEAERSRFSRRFPRLASTTLDIADQPCNSDAETCAPRDIAWCSWGRRGGQKTGPMAIHFVRRALTLPRENLVAVLRHEFGHLADDRVDEPGAERRADRIASEVGGELIRYDDQDLQTIGPGSPRRPGHLHQ